MKAIGRNTVMLAMLIMALMAAMVVAGATAATSEAATTSKTFVVNIDGATKATLMPGQTFQQRVGKGCHKVTVSKVLTTTQDDGTQTQTSNVTNTVRFCGSRLVTVSVSSGGVVRLRATS